MTADLNNLPDADPAPAIELAQFTHVSPDDPWHPRVIRKSAILINDVVVSGGTIDSDLTYLVPNDMDLIKIELRVLAPEGVKAFANRSCSLT